MRVVSVAADYYCYPLWESYPSCVDNVNPNDLPISQELCGRLMQWAASYDNTLNMDDPASSGFCSIDDAITFQNKGLELARQLKIELGVEYSVILGGNLLVSLEKMDTFVKK